MKILIVDDSDLFREEVKRSLIDKKIPGEFVDAKDGIEAMKFILNNKIDLVISDWIMPRLNGMMLLQNIRSHPDLHDLPVIILSSKEGVSNRIEAFREGATDFMSKPFYPEELAVRVMNLLKLREMHEQLKEKNEQLQRLSTFDPLTGLYNRHYLSHALKREWKRSIRFNSFMGCLMIDLDGFKDINDSMGHMCGDEILKEIAELISPIVRGYDFCARYGGDEFIVVLSNNSIEGIQTVAERVRLVISQHCFITKQGLNLKLTASIGCLVLKGKEVEHPDKIIDLADQALYLAKNNGKNRVHVMIN
ncbi:MAG: diguanylate cyclase [Nitrospiria bacterium]